MKIKLGQDSIDRKVWEEQSSEGVRWKYKVQSAKCGMWTIECRAQSVQCTVGSVESGKCSV